MYDDCQFNAAGTCVTTMDDCNGCDGYTPLDYEEDDEEQ